MTNAELHTLLRQIFGHDAFRPGQEALIDALLSGRDVLGVMPTGAGKSICYQLPALQLPGMAIVISPLISLMKDQVEALTLAGVPAAYLNSTLSADESRAVLRGAHNGAWKLLYVAPERLDTPGFQALAQDGDVSISLVAVDEAHCVSQWGQDFRPSYLRIADFLDSLPVRPVVGAFTATATDAVKADIASLLGLRDPLQLTTGFDRPNLFFAVSRPKRKTAYLLDFLFARPTQSGIVYCATRKTVETVCDALLTAGIAATRYHAGLPDEERRGNQEDFLYDRARVMVATNAFGMGIDKSNVSFVVHYNMPKNIESYYQEAGRAGRDGSPAHCELLFSQGDVQTAKYLISHAEENELLSPDEQEAVYLRDIQRLSQMEGYCKTAGCLRAALLRYFGEDAPDRCGNCSNCRTVLSQQDITLDAQKILSCVARVERKYKGGLGTVLIVRTLAGSRDKRVLALGLDTLPTYGLLKALKKEQIRAEIDALLEQGYLKLDGLDFPVLRLTQKARAVLFEGEHVFRMVREEASAASKPVRPSAAPVAADEGLYEALRAVRMQIARREKIPPYMIFSNATLSDMAAKKPRGMRDFLAVSGVGDVKAERYGKAFLEEIRNYQA